MTVGFIGHRKIESTAELKERLKKTIEELILSEGADTFLFGSRSEFDKLCYEVVSELKKRYSHIRRIYVRAEYEVISESYTEYLLSSYEETFYPDQVHGAGALSYIKRNQVMIDRSDLLIVYYNEQYEPKSSKRSGTKIAVEYAQKKKKRLMNLYAEDITIH